MKYTLLRYLINECPEYSEKEIYARILCGEIRYAGEVLRDPKCPVKPGGEIVFLNQPFVSRGGEKLSGLVDLWNISFQGKVVLDAGSSTGGFTDCALQGGAELVYAVDVGYNQLHYKLRKDPRVQVMERTNIMSLDCLCPEADCAVADLSFRSITGAASKIINLVKEKRLYALVKPQFEIEKREDFQGIVKDPADWKSILIDVNEALSCEDLGILRAAPSTVKGRKGNQEFFFEIAPSSHCPEKKEQRNLLLNMLEEL